jgi:hypothetical protein
MFRTWKRCRRPMLKRACEALPASISTCRFPASGASAAHVRPARKQGGPIIGTKCSPATKSGPARWSSYAARGPYRRALCSIFNRRTIRDPAHTMCRPPTPPKMPPTCPRMSIDALGFPRTQKTRKALSYSGFMDFIGILQNCMWCPGPESNRHALRRGILSPLRLPISPPGQTAFELAD